MPVSPAGGPQHLTRCCSCHSADRPRKIRTPKHFSKSVSTVRCIIGRCQRDNSWMWRMDSFHGNLLNPQPGVCGCGCHAGEQVPRPRKRSRGPGEEVRPSQSRRRHGDHNSDLPSGSVLERLSVAVQKWKKAWPHPLGGSWEGDGQSEHARSGTHTATALTLTRDVGAGCQGSKFYRHKDMISTPWTSELGFRGDCFSAGLVLLYLALDECIYYRMHIHHREGTPEAGWCNNSREREFVSWITSSYMSRGRGVGLCSILQNGWPSKDAKAAWDVIGPQHRESQGNEWHRTSNIAAAILSLVQDTAMRGARHSETEPETPCVERALRLMQPGVEGWD